MHWDQVFISRMVVTPVGKGVQYPLQLREEGVHSDECYTVTLHISSNKGCLFKE